ncbi:MAG: DNA methyltransferase, partial [Planctomycetota bacterium]
MRQFPDNCIDSIITDPPYGLSFMGKGWDYGLPGVIYWREALRVAKPGSTLMAFGGSRTYHRLVCAIEDAGWEIRDCIMWIYGSGFPKSLDIGKAIDKANGAEREIIGKRVYANGHIQNSSDDKLAPPIGTFTRTQDNRKITAPSTPLAKQFDGWGTALKPSFEPIVVAQKPLDGTYAENAEKWGVAGIWVDGARIETNNDLTRKGLNPLKSIHNSNYDQGYRPNNYYEDDQEIHTWGSTKGRWPANVIHDGSDEVEAEFAKAGVSVSSGGGGPSRFPSQNRSNQNTVDYDEHIGFQDTGTPSRYFATCPPDPTQHPDAARFHYCPKAPTSERSTPGNNHPTQKPLSLIRYLAKLTRTPTGGIVLDPFAGSGTTALACIPEG